MKNFFVSLFGISYFLIGIVEFFAIIAGFQTWWNLHWIIGGTLGMILTYIPFVGAFAGYLGMVDAWGWSKANALLIVGAPYAIMIVGVVLILISEKFGKNK